MNKMRKHWKLIAGVGLLLTLTLVIAGCAGPAGPAGADGSDAAASCSQCHDDTDLVPGKQAAVALSGHMTDGAYLYAGGRAGCTGCHSSEGMTAMIAAGIGPDDVETAPVNPSPPDCRTCHNIHTTNTDADWALSTTAPVELLLVEGEVYDQGDGNLCATCHIARRGPAYYEIGVGTEFTVSSSHMGPHHGAEPEMLLGVGAVGISDSVSIHYTLVDDGCPTCHVGPSDSHTFVATLEGCTDCHADLDTFDRNDVQTELEVLYHELGELLETAGLVHLDDEDGMYHPVQDAVGTVAEGQAMWNLLFYQEDGSAGIHNPAYAENMLEYALGLLE